MGRRRGGNRGTRAGGSTRPGRDRPRPSVAEAARLARVAGRDRRYGGLPDAEVMLALGGWGTLESWAAAQKIAAAQEMIRRRPADPRILAALAAGDGDRPAADADVLPVVWDKTLGEELALELRCSVYAGLALADLSFALKNRLPLTAAALEAGTLDMGKVRLVAAETAVLTDEQAQAAEAVIAGRWDGVTWGELRDLGAPRGALLYRPCSGHGSEEVSVGLMALPGSER
jgi:hypothetical protein